MRSIFIVILIVASFAFNVNDDGCTEFRTGTFKNFENGVWTNTIIERTSEFQIERNVETGISSKDKIEWLDNCTYQLTPVLYNNKPVADKLTKIIVRIISTENDSYEIQANFEGEDPSYWSKMVKVGD